MRVVPLRTCVPPPKNFVTSRERSGFSRSCSRDGTCQRDA
nr:MAG TPA: hypothetical protein [Caudoviricetes sp.]